MKSSKVHTLDGKGVSAKEIWDEKAEFETKEWMKEKKKLEKEIIQANLNYLCIEEICELAK